MSPAEYRAALDKLGLTPSQFARIVGMDERICRAFAREDDRGPTAAAAFAVKSLLAFRDIMGATHTGRTMIACSDPAGQRKAFEEIDRIAANAERGCFDE